MRFRMIFFVIAFWACSAHASTLKVVASIAPIQSVVAAVTAGVVMPEVLLDPAVSVHDYQIRPSMQNKISKADIVFWGGSTLESFLTDPIKASNVKNVALIDGDDPHFWLSPVKMSLAAEKIADVLAEIDRDNADKYQANSENFARQMSDLIREGQAELAPVADRKYIVTHDAFREFEKTFGLTGKLNAISEDAHREHGVAHTLKLVESSKAYGKICIFTEPQMSTKRLDLIKENNIIGQLDPLGIGLQTGKDFYAQMIRNLIKSFKDCLNRI